MNYHYDVNLLTFIIYLAFGLITCLVKRLSRTIALVF